LLGGKLFKSRRSLSRRYSFTRVARAKRNELLRANGEARNQLLHLDEKEPELARLGAKRSGIVLPLAFLGLHDAAVGVERQQPMILLHQRSFRCIGTEFL
jgi:hypothetical protein